MIKRLQLLRSTLAGFVGLLGEKVLVNIGQDTTLGDGDVSEKLVQFLIVTCQTEMLDNVSTR